MKLPKETMPHGKWYDDACGTAFALELVGERWSLLIVREMMFGPRRFTDLRKGLPSISAKILTERLEGLEQAGIIQRRHFRRPPRRRSMN
jgi:DNA-binding HxlR family transcriptional regulator